MEGVHTESNFTNENNGGDEDEINNVTKDATNENVTTQENMQFFFIY